MSLARRNLFQDKLRFALSTAGVALAVMLILILSGFLSGMFAQIAAYLDHAPGTVVLAQDGVTNLLRRNFVASAWRIGFCQGQGSR